MKFTVVTASYNQVPLLKRCALSVADQSGVEVEHLIQDGGTADIAGFLPPEADRYQCRLFVEKDAGMYDALNRGFDRATGDIVSFLNCDEQYLPGTLARVAELFEKNPDADMVAGDYLLIDNQGGLISFRRATKLRSSMILTDHLYDFTCAMFFRRRVIDRGFRFDPAFHAAGDGEWVARLMRSGIRVKYCRAYLSVFTITGANLSLHPGHGGDAERLRRLTPRWAFLAAPLLRQWRHLEKFLAGGYCSGPISHEIYANENDGRRTRFHCEKPGFRHPWNRRYL